MSNVPIIIPVQQVDTRTECPKCGHKWEEGVDITVKGTLKVCGIMSVVIYTVWTLLYWMFGGYSWKPHTLKQVLLSQWEWIVSWGDWWIELLGRIV